MPNKYSKNRLATNRRERLSRSAGDLTSYGALVGEAFATKINLLEQLIRDAHHPSLGLYRERLLLQTIREFVPRRYDVGTGFVLFPTERQFSSGVPYGYDPLNSADHVVSRQCDLIVYDASEYPLVFHDGDFVVVRPEAVRAVIEVKGSLSMSDVDEFVSHYIDFARKWRACRAFYKERHQQTPLPIPGLYVMAWQIAIDANGRLRADAGRVRERIAKKYAELVQKSELPGFPLLRAAYIYRDAEIPAIHWIEDGDMRFGFSTHSGHFVRFEESGKAVEAGDRTVASLLGSIHVGLQTPFNRFISYARQTSRTDLFPHPQEGFTPWLTKEELWVLDDSSE